MADDDRAPRPTDPRPASGDGTGTPSGRADGPPQDPGGPTFSWQGAPGYSPFDPQRFPPHAPMPGAPPYPAAAGHEPAPVPAGRRDPVLARCVAAAGVWAVVAVVLALVAGAGAGWGLRAPAIVVPFLATVGVLAVAALRARAGVGSLVVIAFPVFWVLHAVAVTVLG